MKTAYEVSNGIEVVKLSSFDKRYMKRLLKAESLEDRQIIGQELLDYLCKKYKINGVRLAVLDKNRPSVCRGRGEKHGDYMIYSCNIRVWNRTCKRGEIISIKSFIDTLLHEFMHHYDYRYLKLGNSLHTAGFYKRISDLKDKLT